MAHSKQCLFEQPEQLVAAYSKSICHPARVRILAILEQMGIASFGYLVDRLPLTANTVRDHLERLARVQLIRVESHPQTGEVGYRLVREVYDDMLEVLANFGKMR